MLSVSNGNYYDLVENRYIRLIIVEKGGTNPPYQKNDQSIMILVYDNYIIFLIKHKSKNLFYICSAYPYYRKFTTTYIRDFDLNYYL